MRLLTWNLRHGGGARRMPAIALAILEHRPDVVVLTEYRRTTGGQIAGVLADHGLAEQVCTDPPAGRNGILVAARGGARRRGKADSAGGLWMECGGAPAAGVMERRRARATRQRLAEVELPRMGITVGAVHVPPEGDPTREAVFQEAVEAARRRRGEAFVLMGDFNAGRHRLDEAGATFTCTRLLGTLAAMGYVDAWRRLHPEGREYTWFSHEGGGFRIDHCFLSAGLSARLSACRYSHKEREMGLSDHSMLVVDLE